MLSFLHCPCNLSNLKYCIDIKIRNELHCKCIAIGRTKYSTLHTQNNVFKSAASVLVILMNY